jgi:hypothetical protein
MGADRDGINPSAFGGRQSAPCVGINSGVTTICSTADVTALASSGASGAPAT